MRIKNKKLQEKLNVQKAKSAQLVKCSQELEKYREEYEFMQKEYNTLKNSFGIEELSLDLKKELSLETKKNEEYKKKLEQLKSSKNKSKPAHERKGLNNKETSSLTFSLIQKVPSAGKQEPLNLEKLIATKCLVASISQSLEETNLERRKVMKMIALLKIKCLALSKKLTEAEITKSKGENVENNLEFKN
ncbi:uncharacterized protein LOC135146574 [Zophobas morio]|uniref:uncharacterized protein LOC135146574 n=1 Tax=Zophobas morio TaxID=2755281 RepID=UPI0030838467